MSNFPNTELELKKLRIKTFDLYKEAKQKGDQNAILECQQLLIAIDEALDDLAMAQFSQFAKKFEEIAAKLKEDTASANAWPMGGGAAADIPTEPPVAALNSPNPAPAGPASRYVSARKIAPKTIMFIDDKGREFIREGGSRSWRNLNPGNIRKGTFSTGSGAIGDDGGYAIFPDLKTGQDAIIGLLRLKAYSSLSLVDAVFRYAPPLENDSAAYADFIENETGIRQDTILATLKIADIRKIASAIKKMEGWTAGIGRADAPNSLVASAGVPSAGVSSAAGAAEDWMAVAKTESALPARERSEWKDPGENPRILNYFKVGATWHEPGKVDDEEDWCAAFVNYCLVSSGHIGTNHPGARSFFWNKKKQFVKLPGPAYGAVAVRRYAPFDDPAWNKGKGHVGFVVSWTASSVELLGGNQDNTVRKKTYALTTHDKEGNLTSEFVAFMMPVMS